MNPLVIFAILKAAQMVSNADASNKIGDARQDAYDLYEKNTDELRRKARDASASTQQLYTNVPSKQKEAAGDIRQRLAEAVRSAPATASPNPIADSTSAMTKGESGRRSDAELKYVDRLGAALAENLGYTTAMGDANRGVRQNVADLRSIGTSANLDRNVLDIGLRTAAAYGAESQMLGDIFGMGADIFLMKGLGGGGANKPGGSAWSKGAAQGPAPWGIS